MVREQNWMTGPQQAPTRKGTGREQKKKLKSIFNCAERDQRGIGRESEPDKIRFL